jgi:uncharacterized protein (TIGR03000 family)
MGKQMLRLGCLAVLGIAGLLATAEQSRAQLFTTVAISTPRGFTFFTFPASYAPTFVGTGPWDWNGLGLMPIYNAYPIVAPPVRPRPEPMPAPKKTQPTTGRAALIQLQVPADARVWLNGKQMKQGGSSRFFQTPPLAPTKSYCYELRVTWNENGRTVTATRKLTVQAGARQSLLILGDSPADSRMVRGK